MYSFFQKLKPHQVRHPQVVFTEIQAIDGLIEGGEDY